MSQPASGAAFGTAGTAAGASAGPVVQTAIELDRVSFAYDHEPILVEVSLNIAPNEMLAILGPNGGGKTTLLQVLLGLLEPQRGRVEYHLPSGRRRLGYVPQHSAFDPLVPVTVEEVALMGRLGLRRAPLRFRADDRAAALAALERLGLADLAPRQARELSGGQRQRLMLARALAGEPEALFLDEPTASLDAEWRESVRELLRELAKRIPVVIVTHDPIDLGSDIDHIACLNRRLFYHGDELSGSALEETYGCPVEMIAHGIPHRVLADHSTHDHAGDDDSASGPGHDHPPAKP